MKTAVITGISGQDGAYLASILLKKNYKVIGVFEKNRKSDLFRLHYLGIEDKITIESISFSNLLQIKDFLSFHRPDEFYNLVALSSVGQSFFQPYDTFYFNTISVINLLEGIRFSSPKTRFYQASSSEMFGNVGNNQLPIRESLLFHLVSPYGISKASAHWLTVNYREAYGLQTCCGILHESCLRPDHFVVKKIIQSAIAIKSGFQEMLTLGNVQITRDWGYAPAYVEAIWLMLQQDRLDDYLICSGSPMKLDDIVRKVFGRLDLDPDKYCKADKKLLRSLELDSIYGNNEKAKKHLNWNYGSSQDELIDQLLSEEYKFSAWKAQRTIQI